MSKIKFTYISNKIKYGIGMSLMACALVSCAPNNNHENKDYEIVNEINDAIELPIGYAVQSRNIYINDEGLKEIEVKSGFNKLAINVYDENDYLSGVELVIKDLEGNIIDSFVSSNKDYIVTGVNPGDTYLIEEKKVPANYELEEKLYKITIPIVDREMFTGEEYYIINNVTLYKPSKDYKENNELGSFIIGVIERGNGHIPGITIEVSDIEGNLIKKFISTEGYHTITNLEDGQYKVKIVDGIPLGYELEMINGLLEEHNNTTTLNECLVTIEDGEYKDKTYSGPIFYISKSLENTNENSNKLTKTK